MNIPFSFSRKALFSISSKSTATEMSLVEFVVIGTFVVICFDDNCSRELSVAVDETSVLGNGLNTPDTPELCDVLTV